MQDGDFELHRWKRVEYERVIEAGIFQPGDRIELVAGHLIVAEPQGRAHFTAIRAVEEALRAAFGTAWEVRAQGPIALDDESEPEPDVAVVPGTFRDYSTGHPSRPVLIVEVSESSLRLDRRHKAGVYARNGIADYWIVNLVERVLEVYRDPAADVQAPLGWAYRSLQRLTAEASIAPLAIPATAVRVADLFP
jgi:Uma2 family endonuclease